MRRFASLFGEVLLYQHQRIVTITKVYIATNDSVKINDFIQVYVCEATGFSDHSIFFFFVYSLFARWQQLSANILITIHSPDDSTPRYAHRRNECTRLRDRDLLSCVRYGVSDCSTPRYAHWNECTTDRFRGQDR